MKKLIIIGTSTTAATIKKFVQHYQLFEIVGFAVNREYLTNDEYCEKPVYAIENLERIIDKDKDLLFVAIQWNRLNADRKQVYMNLKSQGWHFANIISPNAIVNGKITGDNCWIADNVVIDFGATIGSNVFIKIGAFIADNANISNHCFIGAKSTIAGGCNIGEQSFVGLNATIFDCTTVGRKCLIGACTVVKRNLPDFSRCKTISDSYEIKQYDEYEIENKLMFKKNVRDLASVNRGGGGITPFNVHWRAA